MRKVCDNCKGAFTPKYPAYGTKNKNRFCGVDCRNQFLKTVGFKKGDKRLIGNRNGKLFYKGQFDELQPNWKGDSVSYGGLHKWLLRRKIKTNICEHCGDSKKTQWANKDGQYKRELSDYIELCSSCHKYYDNQIRRALTT